MTPPPAHESTSHTAPSPSRGSAAAKRPKRRRALISVVTVLAVLAVGGTAAVVVTQRDEAQDAEVAAATSAWTQPDPAPVVTGDGVILGPDGGTVTFGETEVVLAPGAVSAGSEARVLPVAPIGRVGQELFGQPVALEHDQPLSGSATVRWRAGDLTPEARRQALLARWNPETSVWEPSSVPLTIDGDVLEANLEDFSFWTWIADDGQGLGELTGKRAPEPKCTGTLPDWVRGTVDPDQDTSAAAIRVCFAPDKETAITVRVVNNRTFSQRLTMRDGDQRWAWTWPGPDKYDINAAVHTAAHAAFDSPTTFLVPPLSEVAVGIARPAEPGQVFIRASSDVDVTTVLVDVVARVLDAQSIGGLDNPLQNAFLQAIFECGGKKLLGQPDADSPDGIARIVVDVLGSCGSEIVDSDSEFGAKFESALQTKIRAANPGEADKFAKANRFVHSVARKFYILQIADIAFYLSDQLANAMVGPLSWSVRADGQPQDLGAWTPTCTDADADSNRLYRNLALQDEFADTSKEYWEFPGWEPAAERAVAPLARCEPAYRGKLADLLPGDWGDPRAAAIVAEAIRDTYSDVPSYSQPAEGAEEAAETGCTENALRDAYSLSGDQPLSDRSFYNYFSVERCTTEWALVITGLSGASWEGYYLMRRESAGWGIVEGSHVRWAENPTGVYDCNAMEARGVDVAAAKAAVGDHVGALNFCG